MGDPLGRVAQDFLEYDAVVPAQGERSFGYTRAGAREFQTRTLDRRCLEDLVFHSDVMPSVLQLRAFEETGSVEHLMGGHASRLQRLGDGSYWVTDYRVGDTSYLEHTPENALIHDLENVGDTTLRFVTVELLDT